MASEDLSQLRLVPGLEQVGKGALGESHERFVRRGKEGERRALAIGWQCSVPTRPAAWSAVARADIDGAMRARSTIVPLGGHTPPSFPYRTHASLYGAKYPPGFPSVHFGREHEKVLLFIRQTSGFPINRPQTFVSSLPVRWPF